MKYLLYIGYEYGEFPREEYRPLKSQNPLDAVLESDRIFDAACMFELKILEFMWDDYKDGELTRVFEPRYEKRYGKWRYYTDGNEYALRLHDLSK